MEACGIISPDQSRGSRLPAPATIGPEITTHRDRRRDTSRDARIDPGWAVEVDRRRVGRWVQVELDTVGAVGRVKHRVSGTLPEAIDRTGQLFQALHVRLDGIAERGDLDDVSRHVEFPRIEGGDVDRRIRASGGHVNDATPTVVTGHLVFLSATGVACSVHAPDCAHGPVAVRLLVLWLQVTR
jgi:hypothetical protein